MYLFLPICLLLYFILHGIKARNYLLLVMSLLFYAWGEPKWIILMIVTTLIDYGAALLEDHYLGHNLAAGEPRNDLAGLFLRHYTLCDGARQEGAARQYCGSDCNEPDRRGFVESLCARRMAGYLRLYVSDLF